MRLSYHPETELQGLNGVVCVPRNAIQFLATNRCIWHFGQELMCRIVLARGDRLKGSVFALPYWTVRG